VAINPAEARLCARNKTNVILRAVLDNSVMISPF